MSAGNLAEMAKAFLKSNRIAAKARATLGQKEGLAFARNAAKSTVGNLYIYAAIGDSWFEEGVTAKSVLDALKALEGVKTLNIFINSPGGDVFEGMSIYTQLKRFGAEQKAELIVHVDGIAASAASFIAMAGDVIRTSPAATWMVHNAWSFAMGNADDMRTKAVLLDKHDENIANIYAEKTGRDVAELRELMRAETWMSAEEAKKEGFTDEVVSFDEEDDEEENKAAASVNTKRIAALAAADERIETDYAEQLRQLRLQRIGASLKPVAPAGVSAVNPATSERASASPKRTAPASKG